MSEAVHDPHHVHHPVKFEAKYGCAAEFYRKPANESPHSSWRTEKNATSLNLFLFRGSSSALHRMPQDLAIRLRPLVFPPQSVSVPCVPEPQANEDIFVRYTEAEALAEFGA